MSYRTLRLCSIRVEQPVESRSGQMYMHRGTPSDYVWRKCFLYLGWPRELSDWDDIQNRSCERETRGPESLDFPDQLPCRFYERWIFSAMQKEVHQQTNGKFEHWRRQRRTCRKHRIKFRELIFVINQNRSCSLKHCTYFNSRLFVINFGNKAKCYQGAVETNSLGTKFVNEYGLNE